MLVFWLTLLCCAATPSDESSSSPRHLRYYPSYACRHSLLSARGAALADAHIHRVGPRGGADRSMFTWCSCSVHVQFTTWARTLNIRVFTSVQFSSVHVQFSPKIREHTTLVGVSGREISNGEVSRRNRELCGHSAVKRRTSVLCKRKC